MDFSASAFGWVETFFSFLHYLFISIFFFSLSLSRRTISLRFTFVCFGCLQAHFDGSTISFAVLSIWRHVGWPQIIQGKTVVVGARMWYYLLASSRYLLNSLLFRYYSYCYAALACQNNRAESLIRPTAKQICWYEYIPHWRWERISVLTFSGLFSSLFFSLRWQLTGITDLFQVSNVN